MTADTLSYASKPAGGASNDRILFWGCFTALIATAFGFIVRAIIIEEWGREFGLSKTQQGEIFGVGLWPFAVSIVLFSLVIDKIGYGKAMVFAFICHTSSIILTIFAKGYDSLYWATFIVALGNGTVEAVINPVVATMFPREKTKWLNILHAGWPGGLVLGGIIALAMGPGVSWKIKMLILLLPVIVYAFLMIGRHFPPNERVAAGVPYRDMLKEAGFLGALIITALIVFEVTRVFEEMGAIFKGWGENAKLGAKLGIIAGLTVPFGLYVRSLGRPMFIFLLLIMVPLATTELGTDSWITPLMEPEMKELGLQAGWVLVYTSLIMMILRFFAGPIVHKLSPLGLLAASAAIAAVGLVALSKATGVTILAAATLYGFGKTFFWPTMLGVVSERFPRGGALTLNITGGVGMLSVGVLGAAFLGNIQDKAIDSTLEKENPELHAQVVGKEKLSIFGSYRPIDPTKASDKQKEEIKSIEATAKKGALSTVAIFPVIMFVSYLILIFYFKSKGGYQAEILAGHAAHDEEFTGGVPGPADA